MNHKTERTGCLQEVVTRAVVTEVPPRVEESLSPWFTSNRSGAGHLTQPSRSLLGEEKPKMLINCVTCHFALGAYVGVTAATGTSHPTLSGGHAVIMRMGKAATHRVLPCASNCSGAHVISSSPNPAVGTIISPLNRPGN